MDEPQAPKRGRGRPATGVTPKHNLRFPQDIWDRVVAQAQERDETVTALIIRAIEYELARLKREAARAGS